MATIFQKVTGDNCLILDPREALIYPFNFGNDWTEIRMGVYVSMCASGDDNSQAIFSSISDSSPINRVFIGFKNNDNSFPQSTNATFIGLSTPTTESTTIQIQGGTSSQGFVLGGGSSQSLSLNFSNDTSYFKQSSAAVYPSIGWPGFASTGNSAYFGFYAVKLCITPTYIYSGTSSQQYNPTSAFSSNVGIASLRKDVANATFSAVQTGFFTFDFTETGAFVSRPSAAFIYSPMFDSRLRIHNIVVEKYR